MVPLMLDRSELFIAQFGFLALPDRVFNLIKLYVTAIHMYNRYKKYFVFLCTILMCNNCETSL